MATQMRQQPLNSLATKIISVVFLATFLTAVAVSWISVRSMYAFLHKDVERAFAGLLGDTSGGLDEWLESGARGLTAAAAGPPQGLGGRLEPILARVPQLEALVLTASDGSILASAGSKPSIFNRGLEAGPSGEGRVSAVHLEGKPRLAARFDPADGSGRLLFGLFDRRQLEQWLTPERGAGYRMAVLSPEGDVVGVGSGSGPFGFVSGEPGADAGPRIQRTRAGQFVVGAAVPLGPGGFRLVLEQPFRDAFAPVFAVVTRVFVIDFCIILLFSLVAYKITTAIVRPIESLSEGARRISQGQLGIEIPELSGNDELGLLTRTFNDMTRKLLRHQTEIQTVNARLQNQNTELQQANEVLEQLSITDGLTKLHNHRFFQDLLTREIKRVNRTGDPLAMLLIDIDDFKRLNDRLGHAAGDELLKGLAAILNDAIRETDLAARYGGEEFVVLAPDTDLDGALALAEKIRTSVAEASFILDDSMQLTKMTVSIGAARYRGSRKAFFQIADQALYRAKAAGKNCVMRDDEDQGLL